MFCATDLLQGWYVPLIKDHVMKDLVRVNVPLMS